MCGVVGEGGLLLCVVWWLAGACGSGGVSRGGVRDPGGLWAGACGPDVEGSARMPETVWGVSCGFLHAMHSCPPPPPLACIQIGVGCIWI